METFRQLRFDANLTQQHMADKLGVDRTTVTKWESGDGYPRTRTLPQVAALLGCTEGDVIAAINATKFQLQPDRPAS